VRDVLLRSNCVDCGLGDLVVLEFDHMTDKRCSVPSLARRGSSLARLQREIAKCQIRCANCHRRRTSRDSQIRVVAA
jgi:5-methylcytosine-specific restriction endonuclease McrA